MRKHMTKLQRAVLLDKIAKYGKTELYETLELLQDDSYKILDNETIFMEKYNLSIEEDGEDWLVINHILVEFKEFKEVIVLTIDKKNDSINCIIHKNKKSALRKYRRL